jgi:hypothetical protein
MCGYECMIMKFIFMCARISRLLSVNLRFKKIRHISLSAFTTSDVFLSTTVLQYVLSVFLDPAAALKINIVIVPVSVDLILS